MKRNKKKHPLESYFKSLELNYYDWQRIINSLMIQEEKLIFSTKEYERKEAKKIFNLWKKLIKLYSLKEVKEQINLGVKWGLYK